MSWKTCQTPPCRSPTACSGFGYCREFNAGDKITTPEMVEARRRRLQRSATPGQIAYEQDVQARPNYDDGTPRKAWHELIEPVRANWESNPTPRWRVEN